MKAKPKAPGIDKAIHDAAMRKFGLQKPDRAYYPQIVGQVARTYRVVRGLTLSVVAKAMGLSASGWSRVETGDTIMSAAQLAKIARVFEVSPHVIVHQADEIAAGLEEQGVDVLDGKDDEA